MVTRLFPVGSLFPARWFESAVCSFPIPIPRLTVAFGRVGLSDLILRE
jgi:hypothetical protein